MLGVTSNASLILWLSISLEVYDGYLVFFPWRLWSRKVNMRDYFFGWVCKVLYFIHSDYKVLWLSISLEKSKPFFLGGENPQEEVAPEATNFWLVKTCCHSHSMRFKDSLISSKTKEIQLTTIIENNHQGKMTLKTTSLGWVWPGMPLDQSDSKILW